MIFEENINEKFIKVEEIHAKDFSFHQSHVHFQRETFANKNIFSFYFFSLLSR